MDKEILWRASGDIEGRKEPCRELRSFGLKPRAPQRRAPPNTAANAVLEFSVSLGPKMRHWEAIWVLEVFWRGKLAVLQLFAEPSALSSSSEMMHLLLWAAFVEYLDYVTLSACHMRGTW